MKMRKRINRFGILVLLTLMILGGVEASGETSGYRWYCVHAKDHIQPRADESFSFVEKLGGYYIDHRHTSVEDPDKVVYLTFDAGYENGNVAKVLDVLQEHDVTGAFFILGHLIDSKPELIQRMVTEGHTVCNHTVRHKDMSCATNEELLSELHELESKFEVLTGERMASYYRPPEGSFSRRNLECAYENGYKTVFWSFAYPDWDNSRQMPAEKAKKIILENLHNGEVMLLHPTSSVNAEILGDVIREIKAQGYRFGTLEELTKNELARTE